MNVDTLLYILIDDDQDSYTIRKLGRTKSLSGFKDQTKYMERTLPGSLDVMKIVLFELQWRKSKYRGYTPT